MNLAKDKACLAPMAKITDVAFRSVCVQQGASMSVTELLSTKALLQKNKKTHSMLQRAKNEKNFAVQLFGSEPKEFRSCAELIESQCKFIDINAGCPVTKVMKSGGGSQLLAHPQRIAKILSEMSNVTNNELTVKMRIGLTQQTINAVQVAKICEDAGASLITIHGRTQDQGYSGKANWDCISQVKEAVSIPVVGNGDIASAQIAKEKLVTSGVDFVSVGRACSGNAGLFKQINTFLQTKKEYKITPREKIKTFETYMSLAQKYNTPFQNQLLQAQHVTKGFSGSARLRQQLSTVSTSEDIQHLIVDTLKKE